MADHKEGDRFAGTSGAIKIIPKIVTGPTRDIAPQSFWFVEDRIQMGWHNLGFQFAQEPGTPIYVKNDSWILGNSMELDGNGFPFIGAAVPILHSIVPVDTNEIHYRIEIVWPNGDNRELRILTKFFVWNLA
jgi:hypothetical protein